MKSRMAGFLKGLFLLFLLDQAFSYKICHTNYQQSQESGSTLQRCSNAEYCCANGCCRKVYTIWYFWTLLLFVLFVSIIFCWWYKARQRRQQIRVVQGTVIPMQVIQPYHQHVYRGTNHTVEAPPVYPAYSYPYPYAPPPPYSVAVNPVPPNHMVPAAVVPKP